MYIDSVGSDSPMDMETDGPLLDDVNLLKKAMEEEATQVRTKCMWLCEECDLAGRCDWYPKTLDTIDNGTALCKPTEAMILIGWKVQHTAS